MDDAETLIAAGADQAETVPTATEAPISAKAALDAWFTAHIPNSRYSRDTGAYNRIFNAVAAVKDALATVDNKEV